MDKIYSRTRLIIPKLNISIFHKNKNNNFQNKQIIGKILRIFIIILIAIVTMKKTIDGINPIIEKQCETAAKSIATKISNEQATLVMKRYNYDDLCNVTKDSNREYSNDKRKYNNSK